MNGPFDHLWLGGLFGDPEAARIWAPERQITHMLAFEAAYTRALGLVGKLPRDSAEQIALQIENFTPDTADLRAGAAQDGLVVPRLVSQLKASIEAESDAIHTGSTSQDVIDTALALTLREFNQYLDGALVNLSSAFEKLTNQFGERTIVAKTRMQTAMPMKLSHRLRNWSFPLERQRMRLTGMRLNLECLQLGGAVGDRAAFAPHADEIAAAMSKELGLGNPSAPWHVTRDGLADYANVLSLITGSLGKFGQDICLMAQQGVDEVTLDCVGGSSAMPHKQNPILAELLVTLARFNASLLSGMHQTLVHEQERSGAAWAMEWMILPQMAQATARSIAGATEICNGIRTLGTN